MTVVTRAGASLAAVLDDYAAFMTQAGLLKPKYRRFNLRLAERFLTVLAQQPGDTWQERWTELEAQYDLIFAETRPHWQSVQRRVLCTLICMRVFRPSLAFLVRPDCLWLKEYFWKTEAAEYYPSACETGRSRNVATHSLSTSMQLLARISLHQGKPLLDTTEGDFLEFAGLASTASAAQAGTRGVSTASEILRDLGVKVPLMHAGQKQRAGQFSVEYLVERHGVVSPGVRELLIRYLQERAPALDYGSLDNLAAILVRNFWCDIEHHHPEVTTLALPPHVAQAWRERYAHKPNGEHRRNALDGFAAVRAMYLDLREWALSDPERWGGHVYASPVSLSHLAGGSKQKRQRRAEMQAHTRFIRPYVERLVVHSRHRLELAQGLLKETRAQPHGERFVFRDTEYERPGTAENRRSWTLASYGRTPVMVQRVADGAKWNAEIEEERAFWTWAIIQVLRLTALRVEELLELTDLSVMPSIVDPAVKVLHVLASKTDQERYLPIDPELMSVLAAIKRRAKGRDGRVPLIIAYDLVEKTHSPPLPFLFQHVTHGSRRLFRQGTVNEMLRRGAVQAELLTPQGDLVRITAHDFRRVYATEMVNGGLPLHIAALFLGHANLETTRGYVAVYEQEVVQQYGAFIARRRKSRPEEEYPQPTAEEVQEFAEHFRRRTVALGRCFRPFRTPCHHEHACVRCGSLAMDADQLPRLQRIEEETQAFLEEARQAGWSADIEGYETTLIHLQEKKAQLGRIAAASPPEHGAE
jgi:integrase